MLMGSVYPVQGVGSCFILLLFNSDAVIIVVFEIIVSVLSLGHDKPCTCSNHYENPLW